MEILELKNTTTEIKSSVDGINSIMQGSGESVNWKPEQQKLLNLRNRETRKRRKLNKASEAYRIITND